MNNNKTSIRFNIQFLIILILIYTVSTSCNDYAKAGDGNEYFEIKDSTFVKKNDRLIDNLDLKNGFKNLFLGTNFKKYHFNPKKWNILISHNRNIIECTNNLDKDILINGVKIEKTKLIFFKSTLISIVH